MDNSKDLLIIENMVRLTAVQRLLVKKGLLTDNEVHDEMTLISKDFVEQVKSMEKENSQ
jgi:hypothetical protein